MAMVPRGIRHILSGQRSLAGIPPGRAARVLLVLTLLTLPLGAATVSTSTSRLADLQCYLVQMHLHGHSNHNGNILPASMESQFAEARRHGFDVLWWTDHEMLFKGFENDIVVDLERAAFNSDSSLVVFSNKGTRGLTRLAVETSPVGTHLDLVDGGMEIRVESKPGVREPSRLTLSLASERGKVHLIGFCRPVTSGLRLRSRSRVRGLGEDTRVRFLFGFSWHPGGRHHAIIDLVPGEGSGYRVINDTTVVQEIPIGDKFADIEIDLEAALASLPNGDDNTLSSCSIEIAARNGKRIDMVIESLRIISTKPEGENQFGVVQKLARRYEETHGVRQYIGVEVGQLHTPREPHMNAFLPTSSMSYEYSYIRDGVTREEWIQTVHSAGGIVCANHPFGAALRKKHLSSERIPSGVSARELSGKRGLVNENFFRRVAEPIVHGGAWGADLLEVGYLLRGPGSLSDHLRLWDLALANGVALVGIGTSDSHGGIWGPDMEPNPFASWVWSQSNSSGDLLESMRSGRVVFGDPFLWKSRLVFGVGDALMGDTLFVDEGVEATGWIYMEPRQEDIKIRLVQVEIQETEEPNVIRLEDVENTRAGFTIMADRPCFARIEVYDENNAPLAFTNPVYLIPR